MSDETMVEIVGELTVHNAATRKAELMAALDEGGTVVVDLGGVTELDTAGVQLLLLTAREAARLNRGFELRSPAAAVTEALGIAHLSDLLPSQAPGTGLFGPADLDGGVTS